MAQRPGLSFQRTAGALAFRQVAGDANRHMNTLLVGVNTIERSEPCPPDDLVVPWHKPSSDEQWSDVRDFITKAMMTAVVDGLDQYAKINSKIDGLLSEEDRELVRGGRSTELGRRLTIDERLRYLADLFPDHAKDQYVAASQVLVTWRNKYVHKSYKFGLCEHARETLTSCTEFFRTNHSGACVAKTLQEFDQSSPPSISSLSTLISCAHNLTTSIDEALLLKIDVKQYAKWLLKYILSQSDNPDEQLRHIWQYGGDRTIGHIFWTFEQFGATQERSAPPWAPHLSRAELSDCFPSGLNEALELYGAK